MNADEATRKLSRLNHCAQASHCFHCALKMSVGNFRLVAAWSLPMATKSAGAHLRPILSGNLPNVSLDANVLSFQPSSAVVSLENLAEMRATIIAGEIKDGDISSTL